MWRPVNRSNPSQSIKLGSVSTYCITLLGQYGVAPSYCNIIEGSLKLWEIKDIGGFLRMCFSSRSRFQRSTALTSHFLTLRTKAWLNESYWVSLSCKPISASTVRKDRSVWPWNIHPIRSLFFNLFAGVHLHPCDHEILVIDSLRANTVSLIELEVFYCVYCETVFVQKLLCALADTMLRTKHDRYRNVDFLTYFTLNFLERVVK